MYHYCIDILTFDTRCSSGSSKSWWTSTIYLMVSNSTFCGIFTRILKSARVLTNLVDTFLLWWTIRIRSAFYVVTTDVRIPFESNWTCADRFMSYSSTIRITSTWQVIRPTNWGAFPFSTSMSLLTLAVRLAANDDACHLRISIITR